jgi:tight adherence protein C
MAFLLLIGIMLIASAGALLTRAIGMSRLRVADQMRHIGDYGMAASEQPAAPPAARRSLLARLAPAAERIGRHACGAGLLAPVEVRMLRAAGMYTVTPEMFQGYRVLLTLGPALVLVLAVVGGAVNATIVLMLIIATAIAWVLPLTTVRKRGQRRMDEVDRALPELIDVLIATIEAGLGFAGSLRIVTARFEGPLGQELRLMAHEEGMGLSTEHALSNLVQRCDTPSVRAFARAVTQGETLGVSIGAMLRNLAREVRDRRRQGAREKIMKAPVKMLIPLVLLTLPALFIVLLYPAVNSVMRVFGGH